MNDFGIYLIISNPVLPYRRIAEICVEEEISMLQIREKEKTDREILKIGKEIKEVTGDSRTNLIINDRPDLALLIGAEGYHLGQDDLSLRESEQIAPDGRIRGLSTHNISQVKNALADRPDYIGFGPLFPTPTKKKPDPVTGIEILDEVLHIADIPVVAIGGIDEYNIEQVLSMGARNIALVRYFMGHKDLKQRIRKIKSICKKYWR